MYAHSIDNAPIIKGNQIRYTPKIDSLIAISETLSGYELLQFYQSFHYSLYEYNDADVHFALIQRLMDKVRADNDEFGEVFAYILITDAMCNYSVADSLFRPKAIEALNFMQKIEGDSKVDSYYFHLGQHLVNSYLLAQEYEEALQLSDKFYHEAKEKKNDLGLALTINSMGQAYTGLEYHDKAIELFREAISLADNDAGIGVKFDAYKYLIDLLIKTERINEAAEVCRDSEQFIKLSEANPRMPADAIGRLWFYYYLSKADICRELKQYSQAEQYIAQAETYPAAEIALAILTLEDTRFNLLLEQGRYAEAEKSLDRIDQEYGAMATANDKLRIVNNRANLYYDWEKYDKSADLYKQYIVQNDSVKQIKMATSLHTLRTKYEVDKLEMQKEEQSRSFRNTIIWLLLALTLLCVIIGFSIIHTHKIRAKNRSLLNRIYEFDELEKKYDQMRSELAEHNSISVERETEISKELFCKLKELMKDPLIFTDPKVNRKIIAELLGTNEKYVFDIIKEYYGTNISDYINTLRLNYARGLLSLSENKRTIESIAIDSGFNSRSAFYRLFKEYYGMTPLEFRRTLFGSRE